MNNNLLSEPWIEFNAKLRDMDEEELHRMLQLERRGSKRLAYLLRLYGRYNRLRCQRERRELVEL